MPASLTLDFAVDSIADSPMGVTVGQKFTMGSTAYYRLSPVPKCLSGPGELGPNAPQYRVRVRGKLV